ncbi:MAG: helix-turn-helix domain-containing protein [Oscillospiraceae bacterium]|nr:helix-turn-helix domain-containing protein [Oscillospiraceae bacterium]
MNNEKMGQFIAELRKSHQMTQKDLAAKLDVTDKAVSKWERGLSYPDISLLTPLSNILGITATELLNGERSDTEPINVETSVANALEYVGKTVKGKTKLIQSILAATFSILILLGIFVVSIVNVAVSGAFTWSLIPITAGVFAWLVGFPAIKFGVKGIFASLIALSLAIVPFLYMLDQVVNRLDTNHAPIFAMGLRIAPVSIAFFWIAFFLFKKCRARKLMAFSILALLASPLTLFINFMIAQVLALPWFDVWTVFNVATPILVAVILFIIDLVVHRRDLL